MMAVRASAAVTLCTVRDVQATYRFYKLQSSTAAVPAIPTSIGTLPPSGWSATEPTYTDGSTNSLYTVDLTVFTDSTFNYSSVSLSSSYEAAKTAYNKAVAAANAASGAQTTADGKNTVFRQTSAPTVTGRVVGDVWFDTDDGNRIYTWNGSAWASTQMGSAAIADLAISNAKIADGTIANAKIANLDAGKITTGTISADRIAANTITGSKIAGKTITASNLAAGVVTTDKLSANAVTAAKIAAGTITASQISSKTITGDKIAVGTIAAENLGANSVTSDKIVSGNITTDKLAAKAVTANNMAANSITAANAALADASIVNAKIVDVDAGKIKSGYISADRIAAGTLAIGKLADDLQLNISTNTSGLASLSENLSNNYTDTATMDSTFEDIRQDLSAASIANWCWENNLTYIDGGKIYAKSVTSQAIDVNNLSAISANLGTVTTGVIQSPNYASGGDGVELDFRDSNNNGLSVRSNTKNTMLKIDADGTRVYSNRDLQNPVAQFVDTGVDVNHVNANSAIIAGMQITKVGSEVWITSII